MLVDDYNKIYFINKFYYGEEAAKKYLNYVFLKDEYEKGVVGEFMVSDAKKTYLHEINSKLILCDAAHTNISEQISKCSIIENTSWKRVTFMSIFGYIILNQYLSLNSLLIGFIFAICLIIDYIINNITKKNKTSNKKIKKICKYIIDAKLLENINIPNSNAIYFSKCAPNKILNRYMDIMGHEDMEKANDWLRKEFYLQKLMYLNSMGLEISEKSKEHMKNLQKRADLESDHKPEYKSYF